VREPIASSSDAKPSIAVLPFVNLGADLQQQYFSDGITEDIITELSRFRSLFVIARNSSFQFRGYSVDIAAVRNKLGVLYVVEGSIRKVGARIQLTARLIDAVTERHVWAERYEREVEDIFAVQDDLTRAIAATLEGRVAASGAEQARRRPTRDWAAYDYFLQGREQYNRYNLIEAEPFFARAVELDPGYARAYALWANALIGKYWNDLRSETMEQALNYARKALSLDDTDPWCHCVVAFILMLGGHRDLAGVHFERAVALNPTDVQIASIRALWVARMGRANEALEILDIAMNRDPFPPAWHWQIRGIALLHARRYQDVIDSLSRMNRLHAWDHAYIAACHAYLDRAAEARAAAVEVLRVDPRFSVSRYAQVEAYTSPADLKHLLDGMRKAGLPE
jgi:TolB-like protein